MVAETARVAADVPKAVFRAFGSKLVGVDPVAGAPAGALTTWTMIDNDGYTIPEGTMIGYRAAGDQLWGFETLVETVVLAGQNQAIGVQIRAVDVTAERNGIPAASPFELIDSLAFVQTVVSTTETSGGAAAETDDEYLNRLSEELRLLTPRPILPEDFALLARRVSGVHRARAIDGYDPGPETEDNERMISVAPVDEAGAALPGAIKDAVEAALDDAREVNFVVHIIDPEFTDVDVTFEATAKAGFDPEAVETAAEAAVAAYLDPGTWAGGDEDPPVWRDEPTVRRLELAAVLNAVEGLDYVTVLNLGKNGGAQAAADVALDGVAPLPTPGVIAGTVT